MIIDCFYRKEDEKASQTEDDKKKRQTETSKKQQVSEASGVESNRIKSPLLT